MLIDYALPPVAALLLWWLGTGVVILLDRMPRDSSRWTFAASTLFTVSALICLGRTAHSSSDASTYAAFSCAVVVWGWHELSFLSGWITGPRRSPATPGALRWTRLSQAVQVLLWHELALLGTTLALWVWLADSPNPTAAWTFALLYAMRVSAKLNLFLGVRNLALDFLPPHLVYLGSYFRQRRFNGLMPVSLGAGVLVVAALIDGASVTGGGVRTAHLLLASLLVLALVEHLMMVLPMEPSALWRWALKREPAVAP